MEKKKRNIVEALSMPGLADIEVEFPRVTIGLKPAEFDVGEEEISELDDLAGVERLTPYDPAEALTDEQAIAWFIADAQETGDPDYIARAHEVAGRARAKNKAK